MSTEKPVRPEDVQKRTHLEQVADAHEKVEQERHDDLKRLDVTVESDHARNGARAGEHRTNSNFVEINAHAGTVLKK